jgi:hypothetical protein
MNRRELEEIGMAIGILAVVAVGYVGYSAAADIRGLLPNPEQFLSGFSGVVLLGLGVVLSGVLGVAIAALAIRYWFGGGLWVATTLKGAWNRVTPDSAIGQAAVGIMLAIVVLIGAIGAIPAFVGDLGDTEEGAVGFANRLSDTELNGDWDSIVAGDDVGPSAACGDARPAEGSDRDGDGIPDEWERADDTPGGAPLPGASPDHRDVYVHVHYGETVTRLSDDEKRQLERTWASMPVRNPDGTEGIRLHLTDEAPRGGPLGARAVFRDGNDPDRFYNRSVVGERLCVSHQVVVGQLEVGNTAGFGATPGFYAVVDGTTRAEYDGDVSFRVAITTHELLHNVVGRVDGRVHTSEGWLAGGPADEYLSSATAAVIEERGLTPVAEASG